MDLEQYDYSAGSRSHTRHRRNRSRTDSAPHESTGKNAQLELPHIMMLIDDPEKTVIEPLTADKTLFQKKFMISH